MKEDDTSVKEVIGEEWMRVYYRKSKIGYEREETVGLCIIRE